MDIYLDPQAQLIADAAESEEVKRALLIVQCIQSGQLQQAILLLLYQQPRSIRDLAIALLDAGATISIAQVEAEMQRIEKAGLATQKSRADL